METKRNEGGCTEIERERGERGKGIRGGEKSDKGGRDLLLLLLAAAYRCFCCERPVLLSEVFLLEDGGIAEGMKGAGLWVL